MDPLVPRRRDMLLGALDRGLGETAIAAADAADGLLGAVGGLKRRGSSFIGSIALGVDEFATAGSHLVGDVAHATTAITGGMGSAVGCVGVCVF